MEKNLSENNSVLSINNMHFLFTVNSTCRNVADTETVHGRMPSRHMNKLVASGIICNREKKKNNKKEESTRSR